MWQDKRISKRPARSSQGWCLGLAVLSALFSALFSGGAVAADDPLDAEAEKTTFLRLLRDEQEEPIAMETAVTRYVAADGKRPGVVVDLIGAVHIGDLAYYQQLNQQFQQYDAVLYELVAPEGTRVPKGGVAPRSGVSYLQAGMTKALQLAFQLDEIDYTKKNLVHADLSPTEFAQSMKDRGESFTQIFFRILAKSMAEQSAQSAGASDVKMLAALFSRDRDYRLKIVLAEQFANMDGALDVFNGPDGSTLVTVRNRRAIDVLEGQLEDGKKKIAIFYGAAHMPDMEQQLADRLAMQKQGQQWLEAWDLRAKKQAP